MIHPHFSIQDVVRGKVHFSGRVESAFVIG